MPWGKGRRNNKLNSAPAPMTLPPPATRTHLPAALPHPQGEARPVDQPLPPGQEKLGDQLLEGRSDQIRSRSDQIEITLEQPAPHGAHHAHCCGKHAEDRLLKALRGVAHHPASCVREFHPLCSSCTSCRNPTTMRTMRQLLVSDK